MNSQQLYELYMQQLAQQQAKKEGNSLDKIKNYSAKIGNYGNNLSTVGNVIKDNVNSELAQKFGGSLANFGNTMSKGANTVSNTLNTPQNYFKGFAGTGMQKAGQALAGQSGALGTLGNGLVNVGTSMAGTGAATTGATAGTTAGTTTGAATGATTAGTVGGMTAAGSTAAGAGAGTAAGATGGAAAGSAAGGAAAGGSAGGASAGAAGGPIGALIALAVMALAGGHRKAAKKAGNQLMNSTNKMAEQENELSEQNLQQIQQNTANLQQQADNAIAQGIPTGGAASIQNPNGSVSDFPITKEQFAKSLKDVGWDDKTINSALNGLNLGNKEMSDYINVYNQTASNGQGIIIPQNAQQVAAAQALANGETPITQQGEVATNAQIKQGILDKFANGIADFSRGYQENRNNGFSPENLTNNKFAVTTEKENPALANYQQTLRDKGYKDDVINAVAEGKNSGNKEIADWISNNPSAYKPITETKYYDKSKMGRFGEAVGTVGRLVQNPATQAIVAGGLSTALTGNPLYGLGMAYKFGNGRAMSDIYKNELAKQGVEVDPGMFGSLSSTDMNALMMPQYKQTANEILKARLDETARYHDLMMKYYNDKLNETHDNNVANQDIKRINANARQTSANASVIRANKTGNGKGSGANANKPQNHKDWASDLAGFTTIMSNPKYIDKLDIARSRFIGKYGVDPMKYVK